MSSSIMLLKSKRRFQVSLDIALLWWNCKTTFKLHIKIRSNLENYRIIEQTDRSTRVLNRFFRMWDFLYLKLGIHDFKAKSGRDSGLKVYTWNIKHTCSHTDYGIAQKFDLGRQDWRSPLGSLKCGWSMYKTFCWIPLDYVSITFKRIKKIDDT